MNKNNGIDLLTIGDSSIDLFMKIDRNYIATEMEVEGKSEICFLHGSKVPVDRFKTSIAGNSCNVAVACTRMGVKTAIYTELGQDANGDRIEEELKEMGINTSYCIKNKNSPTNVHAVIVSGRGGERTIFSYHEKRDYKLYDWPVPKWIFYSSLAKGFDDFQAQLINYIKDNPEIGVIFNPGTQQLREGVDSLKNILEVTDVLFVNKEEAQRLTDIKEKDVERLHEKLQKLGPKVTIITLGSDGSTSHDGNIMETEKIYSKDTEIVDKTGAGDSYTGAFISALHYGKSLKTAMRWGSINSSHVIRKIGAINGLLSKEEIEALE